MKDSENILEGKGLFTGDDSPGVWLPAFYAALNGGFDNPAEVADTCLREYKIRFGQT